MKTMTEMINGRTVEEIKQGILCSNSCCDCPYAGCNNEDETCSEYVERDNIDLIDRLESCIAELEAKQPKWISVEDRLPEKQFRVIVRTGHNLVTTGWRSYHVDVRGGELWEVDGAHNYHNDVTHWMLLPSPPMGGAK